MADLRVRVGDWEHQCCGEGHELGDRVEWTVHRFGGELHETHHHLVEGIEPLVGRIVAVDGLFGDAGEVPLLRLPAGTSSEHWVTDRDRPLRNADGSPLPEVTEDFVVSVRTD